MSADTTPNLALPYIVAAQAQKHVSHNEAIRALDALVQIGITDRDLATPPSAPDAGARYIIASPATDVWSGREDQIAAWQDGAWAFYTPQIGWIAWITNETVAVVWDGTDWINLSSEPIPINPADMVGVNTSADTTNRLAVASPATLLTHVGAGHQAKINKATSGDTASLLFQTNWSGRAEFGTTGDDNFHVKVSPDGSTWYEAIVIARTTGTVTFPNTTFSSGSSPWTVGSGTISYSGKVGIGSAANPPQKTLHVAAPAAAYTELVQFENTADPVNGSTRFVLKNPAVTFMMNAYGSGAPGALASAASIASVGGTRFLVGTASSEMQFYINDHYSAPEMTLRPSGLGIGTTGAPVCTLDVNGPVRCKTYTRTSVPTASTANGMMIFVTDPSAGAPRPYWSYGGNWRDASGTLLA